MSEYKLTLPEVETQRLILRPVRLEDAEDMYEYLSDELTVKYLTFKPYTNIEDLKDFIKNHFLQYEKRNAPSTYVMVLKETGKVIGQCDGMSIVEHGVSEVGYVMNKEYWGKGYMKEAAKELIKQLFTYCGLRKIKIRHASDNTQSESVIKACGFVYEGTTREDDYRINDGIMCDLKNYSLLKREYETMLGEK